MKIEGRPYYNANAIESKSKKLLTLFSPDYFKVVKPTPLLSIVDFLSKQYNIFFNFNVTLGFGLNNTRIFGACNPIKRVIFIDSALKQDEHKFNFTLAHELGHLSLHRGIKITHEIDDDKVSTRTINESLFSRSSLKSESDWIEWQANFYASTLLMPTEMVNGKLVSIQRQLGISRIGKIYLDNQPCNQKAFFETISLLSIFFNVSKSAIEYRLFNLKLIDDQRKGLIRDYLKSF